MELSTSHLLLLCVATLSSYQVYSKIPLWLCLNWQLVSAIVILWCSKFRTVVARRDSAYFIINRCVCVCESPQPHGEWNEAKTKRHGFVLPTRESVRLNHVVHATGPHTKRLEYSLKPFSCKGITKINFDKAKWLPTFSSSACCAKS
jgi:hypothetical protein